MHQDEPDARLRRERLLLGGRAKLRERFVVAPESRKGAGQVRTHHDVPLVECDRATQEWHRLLEPALLVERHAQVVEHPRLGRELRGGPPQRRLGVSRTVELEQRQAEPAVRLLAVGLEHQRAHEVLDGDQRLARSLAFAVDDGRAVVVVADRAFRRRDHRVRPERVVVAPDLDLQPRQGAQGREQRGQGRAARAEERRAYRSGRVRADEPRDAAAEQDGEPQARQVAVAVVRQLEAGVHEAADGRQHDRVPRTGGEARRPPPG